MKFIRRDLGVFLALLGAYIAVISFQKITGLETSRIFPVFAWDLFVRVPGRVKENIVLIEKIDARTLNPPRDLREYWRPLRKNDPANFFPLPSRLRWAADKGDAQEVKRLQENIRGRYFSGARLLEMSLIELDYDPLEYWRDRGAANKRVLHRLGFSMAPEPGSR